MLPQVTLVEQTVDSYVALDSKSGYIRIKPESAELKATSVFFAGVLRQLQSKQFRFYCGSWEQWTTSVNAQQLLTDEAPEPYFRHATSTALDGIFATIARAYGNRW